MKNVTSLTVALSCLLLSACHRPVAYFQRSPHAPAARLTVTTPPPVSSETVNDRTAEELPAPAEPLAPVLASTASPVAVSPGGRVQQHLARISAMRPAEAKAPVDQWQPKPKPKPKMRLGNKIRDALGMPLREELNWWQRISWKLKASVIVILIAVLFAILHVTILAIIFGLVGAFLLLSGLRRSFKVRRPWF